MARRDEYEDEYEDEAPRRRRSRDDEDDAPRTMDRERRRRSHDDDDEDEAPRRRRPRDADDEDDAPRRRRPRDDDDDDDDDEEEAPRRRRSRDDDDDEDEAPRRRRSRDDDDEGERPRSGRRGKQTLIHGGWTAGQKIMDQTSPFASSLRLEQSVQVIKFLEDAAYANFARHWVERSTPKGLVNRPYTCLETIGKPCPLCDIGNRPQAVSAFNVVIIGDDGEIIHKSWDVGPRLFNVLKNFANDPKIGPLSVGYYAVSKSGKGGSSQTNVIPIRSAESLRNDYGVEAPDDEELDDVKLYDASVVEIPSVKEIREIAAELDDYEDA